jgi:hypothetical protein
MRLRGSFPSGSSSGCLLDNLAAPEEIIPDNDVENIAAISRCYTRQYCRVQSVYTNISPRNDLSTLSIAVGTRLGRRTFDAGSNSSSDLPNDSLTDHRASLSAVTLPELCHFTGRLDTGSKSSSDYLPSDSLEKLYQQRLFQQLSKSFEALQLGIGSNSSSDYLTSDSLIYSLSSDSPRIFVTWRFDIGNNSSSVYLQSDSLTEQIIRGVTRPAVIPPETRQEPYHWLARHREQLFRQLTCILPEVKKRERFLRASKTKKREKYQ